MTENTNPVKVVQVADEGFTENRNPVKVTIVGGGGGTGAVDSVNGKTGIVILNANDVGAYSKTEVDNLLTMIEKATIAKPVPDISGIIDPQPNVIYLVGAQPPYEMYLYIDGQLQAIGSTDIDLSDYYTKTEVDTTVQGLQTQINTKADTANLATVATSGSYEDLQNKPNIPTVNDGVLTIKDSEGATLVEFSANTAENKQLTLSAGSSNVSSVNGKTGAVELTKEDINLGNVDNTSDLDKPISTATQNALDTKVNTETGKGLSTNDFTDDLETKLNGIESNAQVNTVDSVNTKTGAVTLDKSDIGLGNVDNTSDIDKPISNATQTQLDYRPFDAPQEPYYFARNNRMWTDIFAQGSGTDTTQQYLGVYQNVTSRGIQARQAPYYFKGELAMRGAELNKIKAVSQETDTPFVIALVEADEGSIMEYGPAPTATPIPVIRIIPDTAQTEQIYDIDNYEEDPRITVLDTSYIIDGSFTIPTTHTIAVINQDESAREINLVGSYEGQNVFSGSYGMLEPAMEGIAIDFEYTGSVEYSGYHARDLRHFNERINVLEQNSPIASTKIYTTDGGDITVARTTATRLTVTLNTPYEWVGREYLPTVYVGFLGMYGRVSGDTNNYQINGEASTISHGNYHAFMTQSISTGSTVTNFGYKITPNVTLSDEIGTISTITLDFLLPSNFTINENNTPSGVYIKIN